MQSYMDAHFVARRKVLNPFAASGHLHHAKNVRLYVQMMRCLTEKHPWFNRYSKCIWTADGMLYRELIIL